MNKYSRYVVTFLLVILVVFIFGTTVSSAPTANNYIETLPASAITDTSAKLNGKLDAPQLAQLWNVSESQLRYWFQYSKNSSAGGAGSTSTSTSSLTPINNVPSRIVTGLQENQLYYYRICVTDYAGHSACSSQVMSFTTLGNSQPVACTDTGAPGRSYEIGQKEHGQPTTQWVMQNHPDVLVGDFMISGATGTVCGWEAIQLVSPANPFPFLTRIQIVVAHGDTLINMPVDANTFQWNGSHYYAWFYFKDPVPVYEGDTKHISILGTSGDENGFFTVGIGGVNHQSPGAAVAGLPVFDKVIFVENY